jgi:signal transduction histidine kinase
LELPKEQVQLSTVVTSAVESSRPLIDHLGHELTVTLPKQPIIVDADPTRLAQVFSNLLNNSGKYMDRGGRIRLTAERQGSDVVVSVKDSGIGIAAVAPPLPDVLAGGALVGEIARRVGDRADPGEAAGRDARRVRRGP